MNSNTDKFLQFVSKVNKASNSILNKLTYISQLNNMVDSGKVKKELVLNRKLLSEFSQEEEDQLRLLTDLFLKTDVES